MGERTSHTPGSFSWTDLATSDTEGAKRFYTGLFGWELDDQPIPGGGTYTMLRRDDAGRVAELGGQVMVPPVDVPGGRILVAQDPQGAMFALFSGRFDD